MIRVLSYSLLVTLLCLVGPTAVRALDAADLPAAVENAKTAADHEAIAAYYEAQAKAARAEAKRHRDMGAVYKKSRYAGKGGSSPLQKTMPPHCEELVASYEGAAKSYDAMAAAEREAASDVR